MANRRPIANPIDEFIRDLGGPSAIAKELGLRVSTVNAWQITGRVPKWHIGAVAVIAHRQGKSWPTEGLAA